MNHYEKLEFDKIRQQLADLALSGAVKARCLTLTPSLGTAEVLRWMDETTQAKRIIEHVGTPPLPSMSDLWKVLELIGKEAMLIPEQIAHVSSFLVSCRRMKSYLKRAETTNTEIAWYGGSMNELADLEQEIERCIRSGMVDDRASTKLADIRRQINITTEQVKAKLDTLLRNNKTWFSESFVSIRNGRYTLPVKREFKNSVSGVVVDLSQSGGTCFIEPSSVGKLQSELYTLQVEEDNEVRRILYTLTSLIGDNTSAIKRNIELMETLDFLFAKGKLSIAMKASPVDINAGRDIRWINARHPLINANTIVPLNFEVGGDTSGVVITGPNTGGKTVALKTVGLLSLMVQSGLHVPADKESRVCMRNLILCDIGDGQSISENLSTFSSHMTTVIEILKQASHESLILLDELGSGTDPSEGMGLAVAILDELCAKNCLLVVTTHYPEIKEYADNKPGLINARMAFDKESLLPLYRLEIGEAGESCALYIAERLGMPQHMLRRAYEAAYSNVKEHSGIARQPSLVFDNAPTTVRADGTGALPKIIRQKETKTETQIETQTRSMKFNVGDSVFVYPNKEIGIVFERANKMGELGIQVKGMKKWVNHKRVKLNVPASELYPDDYDFSIIFDSVENRKARHVLDKRHDQNRVIVVKEGDSTKIKGS